MDILVCLSIYLLRYIRVVQMSERIGITSAINIPLQTFCGHIMFISLGKILKNGIEYHRVGIDLTLKETTRLFPKLVTPLHDSEGEFWLLHIL